MKLNIKSNIFTDTTYKNFINEIISRGFKKIVLIVDKKVSEFRYISKITSLLKKRLYIKNTFF